VVSVCGVILVLAAAAGWWLLRQRTVSEPRVVALAPVPLTAAAGYEVAPSPSPDGNQSRTCGMRARSPLWQGVTLASAST
jgi:hypothetical protein